MNRVWFLISKSSSNYKNGLKAAFVFPLEILKILMRYTEDSRISCSFVIRFYVAGDENNVPRVY